MFQNSAANGFSRPLGGHLDEIDEDQDSNEASLAVKMYKSDAMKYAPRPPLNRLRASAIKEANRFVSLPNPQQEHGYQ